jgi:hypothetical protein
MNRESIALQLTSYEEFSKRNRYWNNIDSYTYAFALIVRPKIYGDARCFLDDIVGDKDIFLLKLNLQGPVKHLEPPYHDLVHNTTFFDSFVRSLSNRGVLLYGKGRRGRLRDFILFQQRDDVIQSITCKIPAGKLSLYTWVGNSSDTTTWGTL